MRYAPSLISLIRFAQYVVEVLAMGLAGRLSFGRLGAAVFLRRDEHRRIEAELSRIEALARRALFLLAAQAGPLEARRAGQRAPIAARAPRPAGPRPARAPMFRLTEPQPRSVMARKETASAALKQSRQRAPAASPADLIPAGRLVRRLRALTGVFENPYHHIARMRRLIGAGPSRILSARAAAPVADTDDAGVGDVQNMIRMLQDEAAQLASELDSS